MNRKYGFLLLIVTISAFSQAPKDFKEVENLDNVKILLKEAGEMQNEIHSSFKQLKHMEFLDSDLQSGGIFWYKKPDKIRWEYTRPFSYIIIMNNGKLTIISGNNQNDVDISNSEIFSQVNSLIIASVTGNIFENNDYKVDVFENEKNYYLRLIPKNQKLFEVLQSVDLIFDKNKKVVTRIIMNESENNYSEIDFYEIQVNKPIQEKLFYP